MAKQSKALAPSPPGAAPADEPLIDNSLTPDPFDIPLIEQPPNAAPVSKVTIHSGIDVGGGNALLSISTPSDPTPIEFSFVPGDPYGLSPAVEAELAKLRTAGTLTLAAPAVLTDVQKRAEMLSLNRFDFRMKMRSIGIDTAKVTAFLGGITDVNQKDIMTIKWEDSPSFHRDDPFVDQLAASAGKTPAEIDAAWIA